MTDIDAGKALALNGSLERPLRWLVAIMAIPIVGSIVAISLTLSHVAAEARIPMLAAATIAPLTILLVMGVLVRSFKRAGVYVDQGELVIKPGIGSKRIALSALRKNGLRVVDLNEHKELKPMLRLWGTSLPGFSGGWFRLRNGEKAVCMLLERTRVSYLRSDDGTSVLLSLKEPEKLRALLER